MHTNPQRAMVHPWSGDDTRVIEPSDTRGELAAVLGGSPPGRGTHRNIPL